MTRPEATTRPGAVLLGLLLVGAYLSLFNHLGFRAEMGRGFVYVGWQEAFFWLAHMLLATPGLLLLAFGVAPWLAPLPSLLRSLLATPRRRVLCAVGYAAILLTLALVGRHLVLLGLPVTDDENTVRFGARMIAQGDLRVPIPEPTDALPLQFTYRRDGFISSFDYPGTLFLEAFAQASSLGGWVFAILVALSGLSVAASGAVLDGRRGLVAAALVWLLSPMVSTLSFTAHPQLVSRSFVALAMLGWLLLVDSPTDPRRGSPARRLSLGVFTGLAAGAAFLSRPIEAVCLLAPVALHLSWLAWHRPPLRGAWLATAGSWGVAAALFAAYNQAITGVFWLQARFTPQLASALPTDAGARELLGTNLGFNALMLVVWLAGPLGMLLAAAGVGARVDESDAADRQVSGGWIPGCLAAGVALQLAVALLHADTGIHSVGPIHYSEAAVPLTLLLVLGLRRLLRGELPLRLAPATASALVVGWLAAQALFVVTYLPSLHDQARVQRMPFEALERAGVTRAVVVADAPYHLWDLRPDEIETRSWVVTYPAPDPYLRDDLIFVAPTTQSGAPTSVEQLRRLFPTRDIVRLHYQSEGPPIVVERLDDARGEPR